MFKRLVAGAASLADSLLSRQTLRKQVIQIYFRNHHALSAGSQINANLFKKLEEEMARSLGIVPAVVESDFQKVLKILGLTTEQYNDLSQASGLMSLSAAVFVESWLKTSSKVVLKHEDCFEKQQRVARKTVFDGEVSAPVQADYFMEFQNTLHHVQLSSEKSQDGYLFTVSVDGKGCQELLKLIREEYETFLVARLRGQAVNHRWKMVELKAYDRDALVYPATLGNKVDQLLTAFRRWADPGSKVRRWGSLLIGSPGTGKTTIGGLVGALRPEGCTFIYFPATDVKQPSDIEMVFRFAKRLEPCVLQIDDVDLISRDRRAGQDVAYTTALMEALDGLEESAKLFILLTSNDVSGMDPAVVDRAGRISNKLVFEGFGEVCGKMILSHAQAFGLVIDRFELERVVLGLKDRLKDFTPDEAKNVCQRLYLLHGPGAVNIEALTDAITETAEVFHSSTAQKSFVPVRSNGHTSEADEAEMDG